MTTPQPDVRTLDDVDDIREASRIFRTAMVGLPPSGEGEVHELHEPGRTLGVFVDGELVGGADSYSGWLVAPGGARLRHAAVTHVGVRASHTRRGVLTALMSRQLADIAERGEAVASLRASEAVIYERFGYGVASRSATIELDRRRSALRPTVAPGGPVRLLDAERATKLLPDIYRAAAWPGAIERSSYWWRQHELWGVHDPTPTYTAVHGRDGAEDGYVTYRPLDTAAWFGSPQRVIEVEDLVAHTADAYAGLVRYLATLDLVDTVRFVARPVDDPLPVLFADTRAVRVNAIRDETWLRIVDVAAALNLRTYRDAQPVVLSVTDTLRPDNTGHYSISFDGARRTEQPADLTVDVAGLAAAYLGGTPWSALAQAGVATEHTPGSVAAAEQLFGVDSLPFSGTLF